MSSACSSRVGIQPMLASTSRILSCGKRSKMPENSTSQQTVERLAARLGPRGARRRSAASSTFGGVALRRLLLAQEAADVQSDRVVGLLGARPERVVLGLGLRACRWGTTRPGAPLWPFFMAHSSSRMMSSSPVVGRIACGTRRPPEPRAELEQPLVVGAHAGATCSSRSSPYTRAPLSVTLGYSTWA